MISRWRLVALSFVSALLLGEAACQRVPLLAPSGSVITLTSSATVLPFNGSTLIQAQVIEAAGTPPHSGTHLTFTTSLGTIQPSDAETDSSGIAKVTFLAGAQSGTATITAISGGASVSATGAVKILVGAAAVGRVNVSASPATVPALGGSTTISASVLDVNGNQLTTVPVSFVTTAGTLSASQVITDSNGVAQTTLTTSTSATVTASVGAQGSTTTPPATGGGGTGGTTPAPTTPTSGQASGSVTVNISAAPTLVITPPSSAPGVGLPASFTFAVTVPSTNGSAIRNLSVDWGDMSTQDLGAVTGNAVVSHVYTAANTYVVRGTVTDAFGNSVTASTTVTVIATAFPTVIVTPAAPAPGHPVDVAVQIQVTTPAGISITSATINWHDGGPGGTPGNSADQNLGGISGNITVHHTFNGAGTFPITVTVTDSAGRTTQGNATVTVS